MRIETIIIANIAEAFEDSINKISESKEKRGRILIEHNLCDRTLLWEGDNKIVVTPFKISQNIFNINKSALGFKNVHNLYPKKIDISLSDAVMHDKKLFDNLCHIIKNNPGIIISPYCVTKKFTLLVENLRKKGFEFSVFEMPAEKSKWIISYLDSKIGSRIEIGRIKNIHENVPESIVCKNQEEAMKVILWFYENSRSCVLKTNFGESGWGTVFVRKENFRNSKDVIEYIKKEFKTDSIWNDELILIEEYKIPSKKLSSGSPSSELFLSDKGAKITYLCDQVLGNRGDFLGVALGKNLLNKRIADELKRISLQIGKKFLELGYRGFFDIDFILSENDIPYIIETNMRRTGGTHVYDTARTIFGNDWENKCFVISQDNFSYGKKVLNEKAILDKMKKIAYPIKGKNEGVVISIINKWKPNFGFIILGKSNKKALDIYNKMLDIWAIKN